MSKKIDLTGMTFNELTVISQAPADKYGRTRWNCVCSCGKPVIAASHDLRHGNHKSCGHDRIHHSYDLNGQTFGELKVLYKNEDGTWHCKCSCGKETDVRTYSLTSGKAKTCGHTRAFKDLTGQKFGEWTALRYLGNSFWECQCSCGKISVVHSYSLRNGESLSCGHKIISKKREDLTGQQFNEWTALEYVGGRHSLWKCKCSCGNIRNVAAYDLKNGNSKNCGHNKKQPHDNLVGKTFGHLTVLEYISKGMYKCQCSCGTIKNILGSNLKRGDIIGCGCQQIRSKYTKEFMEATIVDYINENGEKPFVTDIADKLNITAYYVNSLLNKYDLKGMLNTSFGSSQERDIFDFVESIVGKGNVISRDRTVLGNGQELDIYIPSKNLAIEFNGDFWHREEAVGSTYHIDKTKLAAKHGVRLIHVFEYEWNDIFKRNKILNIIKNALCENEITVPARKCTVNKVNKDDEKLFLDSYHLQDYVPSMVAYGLYDENNQLISIMTFGKPRFNSSFEWEMLRYCSKDDISIIGGAEKLFSAFIKEHKPNSIVSYCNISKFLGGVYRRLGFKVTKDSITPPSYVWVYGTDVLTRFATQKSRLVDAGLSKYGDTEDEIMQNLGYNKVYDCGNIRYIWKTDITE